MPLAFNIVADASGRAFVGSLDGSFTCLSVASGAVLWTVALGFGPLSSAAALCVHFVPLFGLKRHGCNRYTAPAASQGVLVMGRNGDAAMLRFRPRITTAFLYHLTPQRPGLTPEP